MKPRVLCAVQGLGPFKPLQGGFSSGLGVQGRGLGRPPKTLNPETLNLQPLTLNP